MTLGMKIYDLALWEKELMHGSHLPKLFSELSKFQHFREIREVDLASANDFSLCKSSVLLSRYSSTLNGNDTAF